MNTACIAPKLGVMSGCEGRADPQCSRPCAPHASHAGGGRRGVAIGLSARRACAGSRASFDCRRSRQVEQTRGRSRLGGHRRRRSQRSRPLIVVDSSAVIDAVLARPPKPKLVARLADDGDLHAPHLIDVEILHALRRLVQTGAAHEARVDDARADIDDIALTRYPVGSLGDRVWALRHQMTAYDAVFVSLAEALDVPLVTCDRRLARAHGHQARVEVY